MGKKHFLLTLERFFGMLDSKAMFPMPDIPAPIKMLVTNQFKIDLDNVDIGGTIIARILEAANALTDEDMRYIESEDDYHSVMLFRSLQPDTNAAPGSEPSRRLSDGLSDGNGQPTG